MNSSNGAELLARTAAAAGVEVVFANPGTTETHLLAAFDKTEGIRQVLCLFEGVCTGAADGYGRLTQRPAFTLLHLGPGLANGLANLHNARRARTPVVNVVGEHARGHIAADSPLTTEIENLAASMGHWVRTNGAPEEISWDVAASLEAAYGGRVATLVVPNDCQWSDVDAEVIAPSIPSRGFYPTRVEDAAGAINERGRNIALLVGGRLDERILQAAHRIATHARCRLFAVRAPQIQTMGGGVPAPERLEHFPERLSRQLGGIDTIILAGAEAPVAFFALPDASGHPLPPNAKTVTLAQPGEDVAGALEALVDVLGAPNLPSQSDAPLEAPDGALTPQTLAAAVAIAQPSDAVVVDEAITTGFVYRQIHHRCAPHTWIPLTGGAIGQGIPAATGAAVAAPDRRVLALIGDGSAMYTVQALWTQARLGLNVTTVICSNRRYSILFEEYRRADVGDITASAAEVLELSNPAVGWPHLASSLGVPGVVVDTADDLRREIQRGVAEGGPHLIEALIA